MQRLTAGHSPTPRTRAFTLVELLVVISIIALLIGILLPALGAARRTSRSIACASNQRQLGLAVYAYAGESKNFLPASLTKYTAPFGPGADLYWFQYFQLQGTATGAETKTNNSATCPEDEEPFEPFFTGTPDIFNSSYGSNAYAMIVDYGTIDGVSDFHTYPDGTFAKRTGLDDIRLPSEMLLFAEIRNSYFFDPFLPNTDDLANPNHEFAWERHDPGYRLGDNDGGLVNVTYADGHVATARAGGGEVVGLSEVPLRAGKETNWPRPDR